MPGKHTVGGSTFKRNHRRELGYTQHGREVVSKTNGLLSTINKMSIEKLNEYTDSNGRFKIKAIKPGNGQNTNRAYILEVNGRKYFIKEVNDEHRDSRFTFEAKYRTGRDGVSEHKGIELLKHNSHPVIPVHFSYVDPITKRSFVVYEYSQLRNIYELEKQKKINPIRAENLRQKIEKDLNRIKAEINADFKRHGLEDYHGISDLDAENVLYSSGKNKFHIIDPVLKKKRRG